MNVIAGSAEMFRFGEIDKTVVLECRIYINYLVVLSGDGWGFLISLFFSLI